MLLPTYAFVVASLLLGVASAQNCSRLNIQRARDDSPVSGASLSVCSTTENQCCVQSYLDSLKRDLGDDLLEGLGEQLRSSVDDVEDIFDDLSDYIEEGFISSIRQNFPAAALFARELNDTLSALSAFVMRSTFAISSGSPERNTTQFFVDIVTGIENAIRMTNPNILTNTQADCLVNQLRMHINQNDLRILGSTLETVRRSFTSVGRIVRFLERFIRTRDNFGVASFPRECVQKLIELSFCGRCKQRIPPLCRNSCGGLIRGCYAAFYSGLSREFDNLWDVIRQLVRTVDAALMKLFEAETNLLGDFNVVRVLFDCGVNSFGRRKRETGPALGRRERQMETVLPPAIMARVEELTGVFSYGANGPEFCRPDSDERDLCAGQRDEEEDRDCDSDEVCTSTCQCWDGREMTATDVEQFTGVSIEDQANNPVIQVSKEEYLKLAGDRSAPVNSFLTSTEFMEVMPEGITIPAPASFNDTLNGGSAPLLVSMVTVLGTLLFTLVCVY